MILTPLENMVFGRKFYNSIYLEHMRNVNNRGRSFFALQEFSTFRHTTYMITSISKAGGIIVQCSVHPTPHFPIYLQTTLLKTSLKKLTFYLVES